MNRDRLEKIYAVLLLVIFGGIILHAPFSVAFGTLFPDISLIFKSWKEILMLFALPMAAYLITARRLWPQLLQDWVLRLMILYAALHFWLGTFFFASTSATLAGLAIDLRYVLFFCLVYVLLILRPGYKQWIIRIGVAGAFVVVCFATLQLFLPVDILTHLGYSKQTIAPYLTVDKNADYIRVNSTLRGPNPLGAYAGMVLGFLTAALVRGKLALANKKILTGTLILGICSVTSLWISYSRSALVGGFATTTIVLVATIGRKLSKNAWIALCVITFALAGALVAVRGSTIVSNVIFHENPNGGSSISSNEGHISSLQTGLQEMVRKPFGAGVGSTGSASLYSSEPMIVENQYLFVAHETGWLGLLLFIGITVLILIRSWKKRADWLALGVFASGIGLALIGLLLPVWADDTVSIIWWGLAAAALTGELHGRQSTQQKATRTA